MSIQSLVSFIIDWLDLLAVHGTLKSLLQHHSSKVSVLWCSAFFMVQLSRPYMTTGKNLALTRQTFVGKVMSLLFNMLSRLVIAFFPRSKHLLISWLQSPSSVILEPKKICHYFHFSPFCLPWGEVTPSAKKRVWRWDGLACVGNDEQFRLTEARRAGQLQKGRRESLVRGICGRSPMLTIIMWNKQRACVPAVQKTKFWQWEPAAKWGFLAERQVWEEEIHSNVVFEFRSLFKGEQRNWSSSSCDISVIFLNCGFWSQDVFGLWFSGHPIGDLWVHHALEKQPEFVCWRWHL